jgi:hypothetical protein
VPQGRAGVVGDVARRRDGAARSRRFVRERGGRLSHPGQQWRDRVRSSDDSADAVHRIDKVREADQSRRLEGLPTDAKGVKEIEQTLWRPEIERPAVGQQRDGLTRGVQAVLDLQRFG